MSNNEKWSKNGPKTVFTIQIGISDSRLLLAGSLWKYVEPKYANTVMEFYERSQNNS